MWNLCCCDRCMFSIYVYIYTISTLKMSYKIILVWILFEGRVYWKVNISLEMYRYGGGEDFLLLVCIFSFFLLKISLTWNLLRTWSSFFCVFWQIVHDGYASRFYSSVNEVKISCWAWSDYSFSSCLLWFDSSTKT